MAKTANGWFKSQNVENNIDLIGFIGSYPEPHQPSNGTAVTNISLATKSSWKKEDGSYDSRTEWHRLVLWDKLADAAAKLSKGAYAEIEGELRHRSYQKEVQVVASHGVVLAGLNPGTT